ncbi:MAG TPA: GNAT family N-acetyltransferase [Acidimicrobiales bacterium]|nr:GNAT family N-acetyltransferase [Acidimicrobiales bacterium]
MAARYRSRPTRGGIGRDRGHDWPPTRETPGGPVDHDVRHNADRSRYELYVGGEVVGIADYRPTGGALLFPHTEIDWSHRGRGLGAVLVRAALDDVRAGGHHIVAGCWYVAEFIDRNPDYRDLLAP